VNTIEFINEQIWPEYLGRGLLILALISAFFGAYSFFKSILRPNLEQSWTGMGRLAFLIHSSSVFLIVALLFSLLLSRQFEFYYVWKHSNTALPQSYIFAAFWEGQEGSFLLWAFWHSVLGLFLLRNFKTNSGVLGTVLLVQGFLMTMLLGRVVFIPEWGIDFTIGSYPFTLTREHPSLMNAPFTKLPDYLLSLDGRGLNPALQNYWMTIHPPTLFLGFALTTIPFGFVVQAFLRRDFSSWFKKALPWAFLGVGILGAGILMGGAWAYEALSFGGFWVWDPVENASLVPWLLLTAGAHMLLIPKKSKLILTLAPVFLILGFITVLYSTFLTRSGVLGDASVHSFTDLGLTGQLLLFLFFFMALPVYLVLNKRFRFYYLSAGLLLLVFGFSSQFSSISNGLWTLFGLLSFGLGIYGLNQRLSPSAPALEDNIWSRDFWMLMGALVLTVSALHLTVETSKPVINKLTGSSMAVGDVAAYNAVQWWFGLLLSIGMGLVLYLLYGKRNSATLMKDLGQVALVAFAFTLFSYSLYPSMKVMPDALLLLGGWFAAASGFIFIRRFIRKHPLAAGGGIAHAGFGLLMVGIVISMGQQQNVSKNQNQINLKALNEEFSNEEHVMLMKGDTVAMADYRLVFAGDSLDGSFAQYQIDYFSNQEKAFSLTPRIILSPSMGNVAEPATKHFLTHDVFTHITYVDLENLKRKSAGISAPEYEEPQHFELKIGDTVYSSNAYIVVEGIASEPGAKIDQNPPEMQLQLYPTFTVRDLDGNVDTVKPSFLIQGLSLQTRPDTAKGNGLVIEVKKINPKTSTIEVEMQRKKYQNQDDFIIMKAVVFPWIKLLWAGCFLVVIGSLMAVVERFKQHGQG